MSYQGTITYEDDLLIDFNDTTGSLAAFTPAVDSIIVVVIYNNVGGTTATTSLTATAWGGDGFSAHPDGPWDVSAHDNPYSELEIWVARVATSTSDAIDVVRTTGGSYSKYVAIEITGAKDDGDAVSALINMINNEEEQPSSPWNVGTMNDFEIDSAILLSGYMTSSPGFTVSPGYSLLSDVNELNVWYDDVEDLTPDITFSSIPGGGLAMGGVAFEILKAGGNPELEQAAWVFLDDDAVYASATKETQDTHITESANIIRGLGTQIQAINDPTSKTFKQQFRKKGDAASEWEDTA